MKKKFKIWQVVLGVCSLLLVTGCGNNDSNTTNEEVSIIGTWEGTLFADSSAGHTEYEECKVKYEMAKDYDIAALTCAGAGVATAFLTAAVLNKRKKTSHESEERRSIQRSKISREL